MPFAIIVKNHRDGEETVSEIPCTFSDGSSIFYKARLGLYGSVSLVELDELGEVKKVEATKKGVKVKDE